METYLMSQYQYLGDSVKYDFVNITGELPMVFSDEILAHSNKIYVLPSRHIVVRHINLGSIRHFKLVENNIKQFTQHINLCFFCALF